MMEFVPVAVLVLGLLSVGHSAPVTNCETLTQQIDIPSLDLLLGKWIYIADVTTVPASTELMKMFVKNTWVNITKADESNVGKIFQRQKILNLCFSLRSNFTLENNTLSTSYPYQNSQTLLRTSCPDCRVFLSNFILKGTSYRGLQFISRRQTLTPAEREEFQMQAECLNISKPVFMDVESDLCPDVTQETDSEATDLTHFATNETINEAFKLFEKISIDGSKLQMFLEFFSTGAFPTLEKQH